MTDLHTHILCGVDDGAKTPEDSLKMLQMERDSGVNTVVLTPHFYRDRQRPEEFFARREAAFDTLCGYLDGQKERQSLPEMILGAEVAWRPNMADWEDLERYCFQGTRNMLLELPFGKWDKNLSKQIYDLMNHTGIMPILAHIERYIHMQDRGQVEEILSLGLPAQISSAAFLHFSTKGTSFKALKNGWAQIVASDCHDPEHRKPDLGEAMAVIEKKLGSETVWQLNRLPESLCLPI